MALLVFVFFKNTYQWMKKEAFPVWSINAVAFPSFRCACNLKPMSRNTIRIVNSRPLLVTASQRALHRDLIFHSTRSCRTVSEFAVHICRRLHSKDPPRWLDPNNVSANDAYPVAPVYWTEYLQPYPRRYQIYLFITVTNFQHIIMTWKYIIRERTNKVKLRLRLK